MTQPFESKFAPSDMRQLALVAHNHMKPAMKEFITTYSAILQKFRITGTQTTMRMCKALWGEDDPNIEYGLTCTSGPLGGDAQVAALMCVADLGALIFFVDPLSAHPHQADIDSLCRLSNCGNIIVCNNPSSAMSLMHTLKCALERGQRGMIPSFFETLESPAVAEYRRQQELALHAAVYEARLSGRGACPPGVDASMHPVGALAAEITQDLELEDEDKDGGGDDDGDSIDFDEEEVIETIQELKSSLTSLRSGASGGPPPPGQTQRRASQALTGLKIPPKKRKQSTRRGLLQSLKMSVRRLTKEAGK